MSMNTWTSHKADGTSIQYDQQACRWPLAQHAACHDTENPKHAQMYRESSQQPLPLQVGRVDAAAHNFCYSQYPSVVLVA